MASKHSLGPWVIEALQDLGGSGSLVAVCRHVWENHEMDLRDSGDLFFTWQYDIRWAAQELRDKQTLLPAPRGGQKPWVLASSHRGSGHRLV